MASCTTGGASIKSLMASKSNSTDLPAAIETSIAFLMYSMQRTWDKKRSHERKASAHLQSGATTLEACAKLREIIRHASRPKKNFENSKTRGWHKTEMARTWMRIQYKRQL